MKGFSYMCFAGIAMIVMSKKGNKKALLGVHVCILLLSFTLVITNSCQLGLIHQYATAYNLQVFKLIFDDQGCPLTPSNFRIPNGMEKNQDKHL